MHEEQSKTFVWGQDWPEEDHSPNINIVFQMSWFFIKTYQDRFSL